MASENIEFKVKIDGVEEEIKSLKDLKQAIKAATDEQVRAAEKFGIGSNEYQKASKRVSELKDKVDDLKDSTKSLQGSGIERATTGLSQFGEGIKNLDFDKVKVGFSAMKTAMAAVGFGLIVQLVSYLIENFDRLSQGSGGVAKALRFVGDIIGEILAVGEKMLNWVTDLIGLTSESERALEKQGETIVKTSKATKEALDEQIKGFDSQIAIAKAAGKNTVDLEIAKQKAIIETNKKIAEQIIAFARSGGQLTDEQQKLFKESLDNIKKAKEQEQIITLTAQKELDDKLKEARKKRQEELNKINEQEADEWWNARLKEIEDEKAYLAELQRLRDEAARQAREADAENLAIDNKEKMAAAELRVARNKEDIDAQIALLTTKKDIELQNQMLLNDERKLIEQKYQDDVLKLKQDAAQKERDLRLKEQQETLNIAQQSTQSLQNLSDLYFTLKTKNLKKGSKEEEDAARKQFNINKALQLTGAVIDGAKAITSSLAQSPLAIGPVPNPAGIASLAAAISSTALSIAKISATQFNSGASSSGGATTSAPSVPIPAPPTAPQPQEGRRSTTFDESGATSGTETFRTMQPTITVKAQVVESDMTDAQKRVNRFDRQTTF